MENKDFKHIDASKFEFVNQEAGGKIHDAKLQTKPTTFAKDALKRFAKNKSSVVGAIIIGVLLIGSFASFFSPYDIDAPHANETFIEPKLFNAGTGFWDGTKVYSHQPYDGLNDCPQGYDKDAVVWMKVDDFEYIDQYYQYAEGGYIRVTSKSYYTGSEEAKYNSSFVFYNYHPFTITKDGGYKLTIAMDPTDGIGGDELCEFRLCLMVGNSYRTATKYVLRDWSKDYSEGEFDLSKVVEEAGVDSLDNCHIFFEGAPNVSDSAYSYFLIEKAIIESEAADEETKEFLAEASITDANFTAGIMKDNAGVFPDGYWQSNANKLVYHARNQFVTFSYDTYLAAYGKKEMVIGQSIMQDYIKKGWCNYDFDVGPESFEILSERCPILEVYSQNLDERDKVYQLDTQVTYWRYIGYSEMPRFLFGTDSQGRDLLTVCLSSLKTSLLVAIISSAICLAIGLVWGAISGYFGGWTDLIMERFTDILSGIPWIIMMTLIMLLLGNNVLTFAFALCLTGWIGTASGTRTQFYRFKGREYVLASRTLGSSDMRLIFRHILPNALGTLVTSSVLMIPSCIFSEASISYLGLGLQGSHSFGVILSENQAFISKMPILIVVPAVIISLLMISFNLFGNGLRDALNPTLKGGEQ